MELGQIAFAKNTKAYEMPEYATALTLSLLEEIERVYWNKEQDFWDKHEDPDIKGVTFRPYWWGNEDEPGALLPNFVVNVKQAPDQEISWYKHPGRGMTCSQQWSATKWCEWYMYALQIIREADTV